MTLDKERARSTNFEVSVQCLIDCGLLYNVYCVEKPNLPLWCVSGLTDFPKDYFFLIVFVFVTIPFLLQKYFVFPIFTQSFLTMAPFFFATYFLSPTLIPILINSNLFTILFYNSNYRLRCSLTSSISSATRR